MAPRYCSIVNFSTDDDDPMLVPVKNGRPIDFCKQWSGDADFVGGVNWFLQDRSSGFSAPDRGDTGAKPWLQLRGFL